MGSSSPETMRAALLVAPGRMVLGQLPLGQPGPHDVQMRPRAVGLCGTDFHIHRGEANYHTDRLGAPVPLTQAPQVLGHEFAGSVERVGSAVTDLEVGDRVVLDQGLSCTSTRRETACEYCVTGDSHQCEHYAEHGITGLPGALAEAVTLPAVNAVRIGSGLSFEEAALTEPLACVLHTLEVARRARTRYALTPRKGAALARSILITGAGPAGLLFVQVLRSVFGFEGQLLVSDPNPRKRALAESFGAHALDPSSEDLAQQVDAQTGGRRVEVLVEASGAGAVFEDVPRVTRKQATLIMYGYGHSGTGLEVFNAVQFREPVLVTTTGASGGFDPDGRPSVYRRALRLIEEGRIDVRSLVTHRYEGLEAVPAAFEGDHLAADYVKGVVLL